MYQISDGDRRPMPARIFLVLVFSMASVLCLDAIIRGIKLFDNRALTSILPALSLFSKGSRLSIVGWALFAYNENFNSYEAM